jgi:hypothetical protein
MTLTAPGSSTKLPLRQRLNNLKVRVPERHNNDGRRRTDLLEGPSTTYAQSLVDYH